MDKKVLVSVKDVSPEKRKVVLDMQQAARNAMMKTLSVRASPTPFRCLKTPCIEVLWVLSRGLSGIFLGVWFGAGLFGVSWGLISVRMLLWAIALAMRAPRCPLKCCSWLLKVCMR